MVWFYFILCYHLIKSCECMLSTSVVSDSEIPWIVACQALLSMGFPRQQYRTALLFPTPGALPHPRMEPASPVSPGSLPLAPPGKPN